MKYNEVFPFSRSSDNESRLINFLVKKAKEDYNPSDPAEAIEMVIPIEDRDWRRMELKSLGITLQTAY